MKLDQRLKLALGSGDKIMLGNGDVGIICQFITVLRQAGTDPATPEAVRRLVKAALAHMDRDT